MQQPFPNKQNKQLYIAIVSDFSKIQIFIWKRHMIQIFQLGEYS